MNILVTGVSGFVGKKLFKFLAQDFYVFGITRREHGSPSVFNCDLNDFSDLCSKVGDMEFDVIIHTAGSAKIVREIEIDSYSNNIISTLNVLNLANLTKTKKIIFLSSNMVYGKSYNIKPENASVSNPFNWYSRSKAICEQILSDNQDIFSIAIIRLPSILGLNKNTSDLISDMIGELKREGRISIFGAGHSKRQYIHVDDIAEAIKKLISTSFRKLWYIPAVNEEILTIKQIGEKIINFAGFGQLTYLFDQKDSFDQYVSPEPFKSIHLSKKYLNDFLEELRAESII